MTGGIPRLYESNAMRLGRFRFSVRRMMVAAAVIGLAFAYAAKYYACTSIANDHVRALTLSWHEYPFDRTDTVSEMDDYHVRSYDTYKQAAIYPWVRVQYRFVPFDDVRRTETAPFN